MSKTTLDFLKTHSGRELLKKHDLKEDAIWLVRGEDRNPDFHGSHHMPTLGYYSGILEDVIAYAVKLPNFWQWGAGGDITKINIKPIDKNSVAIRESLISKKANLERELREVSEKLDE